MTKKEKHLHFTINRKIAVDCKNNDLVHKDSLCCNSYLIEFLQDYENCKKGTVEHLFKHPKNYMYVLGKDLNFTFEHTNELINQSIIKILF